MMKKIRVAALLLALSLLCGCSAEDFTWFTSRFQTEQTQTPSDAQNDSAPSQSAAPTAVPVTETLNELNHYGLSYQEQYGLDPYECEGLNNRVILSFVYEPLFAVSASCSLENVLAEDWSVSDDGKTTTVRIRPGVLFHDGSELSAGDAVYSLEASRDSVYYGKRLYKVESMEALDEYTLVFTTSCAYECLPLLLDIPIVKAPDGESGGEFPVGTGPYRFDGTERLLRWRDWWQSSPAFVEYDAIDLVPTTTTASVRDNFEYENVNLVLTDPNSSAYAGFRNDYELWEQPVPIMQYIGYNLTSKVFSNYGLRGAITYAIDREGIATEQMGGFASAAVLPCLPQSVFYDSKLAAEYSYNMENFFQKLESASISDIDNDNVLDLYVPSLGYSVPVSGTMIVCSSSLQRVQAAERIVETLNGFGFDLHLKSMENSEYQTALAEGAFDLYYGETRLSPNFDLTHFFGASGGLNFGELADSTMYNLCEMALVNSGNTYNLYKRVCERGYLTPVLFKSYAVYTTRGSVSEPNSHIDWFLPYTGT